MTAPADVILELKGLTKRFGRPRRGQVTALDDVSMVVPRGEITCLVGESGSGKSTAIRCILGLEQPDSGWVEFDGERLATSRRGLGRERHRDIQIVFQDPTSSLNPRMTAAELIAEGLVVHKLIATAAERAARVAELMAMVGLDPAMSDRRPRVFSGGQRQRIAIARALAVQPRLLICDEAVSALDVSVQAQILNLLLDLRETYDLSVLFVAHDLAVVRQIASQVVVLERGRVVEAGPCEQIFDRPQSDYTKALLEAVPVPDPALARARASIRRS